MSNRKDKRTKSYRGHKTHGCGNAKNRRGSGNRGGVGQAGLNKHKKTWMVKFDPDHFGNFGFVNHGPKTETRYINVFEIENMVKGGLAGKEGAYAVRFEGKILGSGELNHPVHVKAQSWSANAEEKVKAAGGKMEKLAQTGKAAASPAPKVPGTAATSTGQAARKEKKGHAQG
jgi:large subunit ribosomal protein L15